jgi:hypothetical protein
LLTHSLTRCWQGRAQGFQGGDGAAARPTRQDSRAQRLARRRQTGENRHGPLRQRLGQMSSLLGDSASVADPDPGSGAFLARDPE